jgi:hypothetical protein
MVMAIFPSLSAFTRESRTALPSRSLVKLAELQAYTLRLTFRSRQIGRLLMSDDHVDENGRRRFLARCLGSSLPWIVLISSRKSANRRRKSRRS